MNLINLVIMSDDLGMHPAINQGIARAFTDGVLTSTNIMAPCPAFREGAEIARSLGIPVGLHAVVTCEWDRLRWGPLTGARSLRGRDGGFRKTRKAAWDRAKDEDVLAELRAQFDAAAGEGLALDHVDLHMMNVLRFARLYARLPAEYIRPLRTPTISMKRHLPSFAWDSIFSTSSSYGDYRRRKDWLLKKLQALAPGYHLWIAHVAEDRADLDEICTPKCPPLRWAREYRALDMRLVLDPQVRDQLDACGIRRISCADVPVVAPFARAIDSASERAMIFAR